MIRSLLAGAVDYAGLFPPAGLPMPDAARNYAAYRQSGDAWALGRFVLPAARLGELAGVAADVAPPRAGADPPWRLSALVAGDGASEFVAVATFNDEFGSRGTAWSAVVDSVEGRCDDVDAIAALSAHFPRDLAVFVEIPVADDPARLVEAIAHVGRHAKVRTGGTTAAHFPSAPQVARFLRRCVDAGIAFKATAGLHHPLRAEYPLTYERGSGQGTMFGFLNLFVAAAVARAGAGDADVVAALEERDPDAVVVAEDAIAWRGQRIALADLEATRARFALSFGSCSFDEPLADLRRLGLLR